MVKFSNREFLFRFTSEFKGPITMQEGDLLWSRVASKVFNGTEYFMFWMLENDPHYQVINDEFYQIFEKKWNGQYLVPCSVVRFDEENEEMLSNEKEQSVSNWKNEGGK